MPIDVEALSATLSAEAPSGPDLSYDAGRQPIEAAFERSVSSDAQGEPVDWRRTIQLVLAQAEVTRDLWLAIYLTRAGAGAGQLDTVAAGADLLAALLEDRWADVHPQLDEVGYEGRKAACESLTRVAEFLGPLQRSTLIEHPRLGRFSGADFERFHERGDKEDGFGAFRAAVDAAGPEQLQAVVDRLDALRQAIRRADAVLMANADGTTGANFQPTYDAIERIRRAVATFLPPAAGDAVAADHDSPGAGGAAAPPAAAPSGASFSGAINSREDVARALDAIAAYYARYEPVSPVPFALRRARDWISLDFLAVLEDIAPGSLDEARRVLVNGRTQNSGHGVGPAASVDSGDGWSS
ncbi:MAG: type VI secretion system ImpA family N-terminal domain-containing protein [Novosphingobium sp.]